MLFRTFISETWKPRIMEVPREVEGEKEKDTNEDLVEDVSPTDVPIHVDEKSLALLKGGKEKNDKQ